MPTRPCFVQEAASAAITWLAVLPHAACCRIIVSNKYYIDVPQKQRCLPHVRSRRG